MWICTAAWWLRPLNRSSFIFPAFFPTFGKRSVSHLRLEKCMEEALKKIYVTAAYVLLPVICRGSRATFHLRLEIWPWWPELFRSRPALFKATGPPPAANSSLLDTVKHWGPCGPCWPAEPFSPQRFNLPQSHPPAGWQHTLPLQNSHTTSSSRKGDHRMSIADLLVWSWQIDKIDWPCVYSTCSNWHMILTAFSQSEYFPL